MHIAKSIVGPLVIRITCDQYITSQVSVTLQLKFFQNTSTIRNDRFGIQV